MIEKGEKSMPSEQYRRTCTRIGIVLLVNTLLLQVLSTVAMLVNMAKEPEIRALAEIYNINPDEFYYAFDEVTQLLVYLISFLIPAFLFKILSRKSGCEPMRLGVRLEPNAPLVIIGAIGVILTAAYLNSLMVSFIDFSSLFAMDPLDSPVKILLAFISIAIVPAVAEEFLFRGCVLSNLLPYGKTTAIVISALLFSLMHGNFAQFFYTFVAGLVLGAVYVETGSIWTSTFIHLFNNFYGVIQQVIYDRNPDEYTDFLLFVGDAILPLAGLAVCGWLLYSRIKNGAPEDAAKPTKKLILEKGEAAKGFFRPVVIAHIAVSLLLAITIVLTVLFNSYLT